MDNLLCTKESRVTSAGGHREWEKRILSTVNVMNNPVSHLGSYCVPQVACVPLVKNPCSWLTSTFLTIFAWWECSPSHLAPTYNLKRYSTIIDTYTTNWLFTNFICEEGRKVIVCCFFGIHRGTVIWQELKYSIRYLHTVFHDTVQYQIYCTHEVADHISYTVFKAGSYKTPTAI